MKLEAFQEQVFFATIRVTLPKPGIGESIGTGFLMRAPVGADASLLLLVSNRHVFGDSAGTVALNFHSINSSKSGPELGRLVEFKHSNFGPIYYPHPDPTIDLACLDVSAVGPPGEKAYYRNVYPEMIATFAEDDLLPGNDIWFVGYPENRFDVAHNLPLLRRGHIASIPKVDFNRERQFVIDAQVFPGSSGSPVFAGIQDKYRLVGVVTATMVKNQILQPLPHIDVQSAEGIQQVIGLGLVIKATAVSELIDFAVAEWQRRRIPHERSPAVP